eukprot:RCo022380
MPWMMTTMPLKTRTGPSESFLMEAPSLYFFQAPLLSPLLWPLSFSLCFCVAFSTSHFNTAGCCIIFGDCLALLCFSVFTLLGRRLQENSSKAMIVIAMGMVVLALSSAPPLPSHTNVSVVPCLALRAIFVPSLKTGARGGGVV